MILTGERRPNPDAQFCPLCGVTLDLHNGPDTCADAEGKARVLELFGRGMYR